MAKWGRGGGWWMYGRWPVTLASGQAWSQAPAQARAHAMFPQCSRKSLALFFSPSSPWPRNRVYVHTAASHTVALPTTTLANTYTHERKKERKRENDHFHLFNSYLGLWLLSYFFYFSLSLALIKHCERDVLFILAVVINNHTVWWTNASNCEMWGGRWSSCGGH